MQVILLEKLPNLGSLGDIVKVKAGYARNYLIPKGKTKRATESNVAEFGKLRADLEKAQNESLLAAQAHAAKLERLMIQVTQKAGVDGRLFGSVTNSDISEALKAQGFDVPRAAIRLPHGLFKQVGDYEVTLDLHTDAKAHIKVSVLGEQ